MHTQIHSQSRQAVLLQTPSQRLFEGHLGIVTGASFDIGKDISVEPGKVEADEAVDCVTGSEEAEETQARSAGRCGLQAAPRTIRFFLDAARALYPGFETGDDADLTLDAQVN